MNGINYEVFDCGVLSNSPHFLLKVYLIHLTFILCTCLLQSSLLLLLFCHNLLTGPITMCTPGHTCNSDLTEAMQNLAIEEMSDDVGHPCPFKSSGCNVLVPQQLVSEYLGPGAMRKSS